MKRCSISGSPRRRWLFRRKRWSPPSREIDLERHPGLELGELEEVQIELPPVDEDERRPCEPGSIRVGPVAREHRVGLGRTQIAAPPVHVELKRGRVALEVRVRLL